MYLKSRFSIVMICLIFPILLIRCEDEPVSSLGRYQAAADQGINPVQLMEAIDHIQDVPGIKSIVLGRGGTIAFEEYFNDGGADSLHDVRSVTKSVMGLLIGLAVDQGYIENLDQTVGDFFIGSIVDSLEPAKASITIEHLLTMSCGLEWHELDGGDSYSTWYGSYDHVKWVLDQPFIHQPGQGFNYNTGSTHLLSVILTLATGQTALAFAQKNLFEPMGIGESDWTVITDRVDEEMNNGGAGLQISPRAMFMIGNLMLNNGRIHDLQVVPADWISRCRSIQNTAGDFNPYGTHYGYLWWIGSAHGHDHYFAMGWGGQFIVCVPDLDLVVVATCHWRGVSSYNAGQNWNRIFLIIMDEIIPAVDE